MTDDQLCYWITWIFSAALFWSIAQLPFGRWGAMVYLRGDAMPIDAGGTE